MYRGLNEAVVTELQMRYTRDVITSLPDSHPARDFVDFQESEEVGRIINQITKYQELDYKEILYVQKNVGGDYAWNGFAYKAQRKVLDFIVSCAAEVGVVPSKEEAMLKFFRAHFTGHLVGIAKLIDKTFGPGTFRLLKYMNDDNSANSILDDLQKKIRLKKTKKSVE